MKRLVLSAFALALSCAAAGANALHLNPAPPAGASNMQTFGRTTIPVGYYEYGRFRVGQCRAEELLWRDAEIYFLKRQAQTDPNSWVSLASG
ncbi:hypothetical protein [Mesorhizobium delmotii]|uniref:Uncharacterized protein n=1 Tax=Mesorhizobium delmotii TaxID=1631247 RepID=A0A2P9ARE4_9HYPH|nr:hypothetical protein [Mesorhizobium delmotii]SJM33735.1 exported hypothetical protein [Mesorhizobium delmotii]